MTRRRIALIIWPFIAAPLLITTAACAGESGISEGCSEKIESVYIETVPVATTSNTRRTDITVKSENDGLQLIIIVGPSLSYPDSFGSTVAVSCTPQAITITGTLLHDPDVICSVCSPRRPQIQLEFRSPLQKTEVNGRWILRQKDGKLLSEDALLPPVSFPSKFEVTINPETARPEPSPH
jgi:hypothetical protein